MALSVLTNLFTEESDESPETFVDDFLRMSDHQVEVERQDPQLEDHQQEEGPLDGTTTSSASPPGESVLCGSDVTPFEQERLSA